MKAIEILYAANVISRRNRTPHQVLTFGLLVRNDAYDKVVEVRWVGEDGAWHTLGATHVATAGDGREFWRAETQIALPVDRSLPGNVLFSLYARMGGGDHWDNNGGANYAVEADSGIWLPVGRTVVAVDPTPRLEAEQRIVPITVAVAGRPVPHRVAVEWSIDGWRTKHRTECTFVHPHWEQVEHSNARNPNQYGVGMWTARLRIQEAFSVEYAVVADVDGREVWDNNAGANYRATRREFKLLILNLHCYQEENQDAKLWTIARAIQDLNVDVVCFQEVADPWNEGHGEWATNTARLIQERVGQDYHLYFDWSHLGFDRYREGVAILSRYPFRRQESRYLSASEDRYDIHARRAVMVQVEAPYVGPVNIFSVHLSWWSNGFREQFDALRGWAQAEDQHDVVATLAGGDFNAKAGGEGYAHIVHASSFEDQYLKVTNPKVFDRVFRTHEQDWQRRLARDGRIDFVLLLRQSKLRATAAQVLFTDSCYGRVSDHEGYLITFEPK